MSIQVLLQQKKHDILDGVRSWSALNQGVNNKQKKDYSGMLIVVSLIFTSRKVSGDTEGITFRVLLPFVRHDDISAKRSTEKTLELIVTGEKM